jgi:hypothetical protein
MMAAAIQTSPTSVRVDFIRELFSISTPPQMVRSFPYDVTADGQRFLVALQPEGRSGIPLTVVMNWDAGLKK